MGFCKNSIDAGLEMGLFLSAFISNEKKRLFQTKKRIRKKEQSKIFFFFFFQIFILIIVLQAICTDYSILDAYLKIILRSLNPYK